MLTPKIVAVVALLVVAAGSVSAAPGSFRAAYHYITCKASAIVQPTSTAQLAAVIKGYAARAARGTPVALRATRDKFHSSTTFPCPTSAALTLGGGAPITVGVLHSKLDQVLAVDKRNYRMRVGAGMDLNKLFAAATKNGMSVQIGSMTAYAGLTLGGILSASAHGMGDMATQSLDDTVLSVTYVDGRGNIITRDRKHPDYLAIPGGMGQAGVITEMVLQLTPPTLTQLTTWYMRNDKDLVSDIPKMLKVSPHVLIFWRPDSGVYSAYIIKEAPKGAKPNPAAVMSLLPDVKAARLLPANMKTIFGDQQRNLPDDPDFATLACPLLAPVSISAFGWASVNNRVVQNVTGYTNRMQASECGNQCLWTSPDLNSTSQDVEFTIEHARLNEWIGDVRRIIRMDLKENGKRGYRCLAPGYLWLRFGRGSNSYLATNSGMKRPVYVQSTWLRSREAMGYPMRYQFVQDLIEEVTLCKHNGRPHWGKNHDRTFTHPRCPVRPKYPNFGKALAAYARADPAGMFRPALFTKVVKQQSYSMSPRCTLTQDCYCTQDIHCVKGMKCVPALSFPQFKVCKYMGKDAPGSTDLSSLFPEGK